MADTAIATSATKELQLVPKGEIMEIIAENMDGQITSSDLDRVKIPAGGGIAFEVPTLEGADSQKYIDGVIIAHQPQNVYWSTGMDEGGGNTPPDCVARDGKFGEGAPGGLCATCPMNKFGSDGGNGKACKNTEVLFILRPGNMLPIALRVPPTSLGAVKKYLLQLTSASIPFYGVQTRLSLEKATNAAGIGYSKLVLAPLPFDASATDARARLMFPADTVVDIKAYRDALLPQLQAAAAVIESDAQ